MHRIWLYHFVIDHHHTISIINKIIVSKTYMIWSKISLNFAAVENRLDPAWPAIVFYRLCLLMFENTLPYFTLSWTKCQESIININPTQVKWKILQNHLKETTKMGIPTQFGVTIKYCVDYLSLWHASKSSSFLLSR